MRDNTPSTTPYSRHARRRASQRAITDEKVQAALDYGFAFHAGDGVVAFWLSRKAVAEAKRRFGVRVDAHTNLAVFISVTGEMVTAYKVDHRKRCWTASGRLA